MQLCYRKKVKKFTKRVRYVLEYEHKYWAFFFERRDYMGEKRRDKKIEFFTMESTRDQMEDTISDT